MKLSIRNTASVRSMLKKYKAAAVKVLASELYKEGERIMLDSKNNYVPVDLGALKSSGHVQAPVIGASGISVTLGYGGASAPYAIYVHEDLNAIHPVGQAKFLEIPVRRAGKGTSSRVADGMRRRLKNVTR